jgi:hypothetical protein
MAGNLVVSTINDVSIGVTNAIINGNFNVNQRALSGTVTLGANEYGHDRWKGGASGCTYTFSTTNNITTIVISAGSLIQVVEGVNLQSGTYALSWSGTAQGKIGAGSYGATNITGTVVGGTNINIEFGTGALSRVQFEKGTISTLFQFRPYGTELALCQRYYWRAYAIDSSTRFGQGLNTSTTLGKTTVNFPVPMRTATNSFEQSGTSSDYKLLHGSGTSTDLSDVLTLDSSDLYMATLDSPVASGLTAGGFHQLVANNANAYVGFSAEL